MNKEIIYNIDLHTSNKDIISVSSDYFNHFYIANIDNNGDEFKYKQNSDGSLYANFFMLKLLKSDIESNIIIDTLNKQPNIIKITVCFTNGNRQEFELAKKRVAYNGHIINEYETTFFDEEDLCILITDKNIKYKDNLFA